MNGLPGDRSEADCAGTDSLATQPQGAAGDVDGTRTRARGRSDEEGSDEEGSDEECSDEEESDEEVDDEAELLLKLFHERATVFHGARLMNCPDWMLFIRDLGKSTGYRFCTARMEGVFSEALQLQRDTRIRFDLSAVAAAKGLCFESFRALVAKALPHGAAQKFLAENFGKFTGAALLRGR